MRFFVSFAVLAVFAVTLSHAYPAGEEEQIVAIEEPAAGVEALLAVDAQGHENEGDRQARQFGFPGFGGGYGGGYRGGYGGGYGGYRGGYGGGGFGGYRGGYGGGYGGYRGGYGGGYRGGFYG